MKKLLLGLALAAAVTTSLHAEVKPSALFADHAVLQRGVPVPVWGTAAPGETVTVEFAGQSKRTTADASGQWSIKLDPLQACSVPAELRIQSKSSDLKFQDILVGEVWLCSGQSNMQFSLSQSNGGAEAVSAANLPEIRVFVGWGRPDRKPATQTPGKWQICTPGSAKQFTAVGFYFAREIQPKLGVPVALLQFAVGGTKIETWMSEKTFQSNAADPAFAAALESREKSLAKFDASKQAFPALLAAWKKERDDAKATGAEFTKPEPKEPNENLLSLGIPTAFYNGMLHPAIPYAIRGALWYQGESNLGRDAEYAKFFPALIHQWRTEWGQGDFPFYFVQLPFYNGPTAAWAGFRETQAKALSLPNTGMAVILDLGDTKSIHPKDKLEVGVRLAGIALNKTYGKTDVEWSGPTLEKIEKVGSSLRLTFSHADGMSSRGGAPKAFEIAGANKKFASATAVIEGNQIVLSNPNITEPVHASCGWNWNDALPNTYNKAGFLITPFRTSPSSK